MIITLYAEMISASMNWILDFVLCKKEEKNDVRELKVLLNVGKTIVKKEMEHALLFL